MILRYKTKAVETLNLTIAEQQEPRGEYQPKLFSGEQRKLYRDDITPLTDEERKTLEASISGVGCFLFLTVVTAAAVGGLFLYYKDDFKTAYQFSSIMGVGAVIVFFIFWHGNGNTRRELSANRKRIVIAPVLRLARTSEGSYKSPRHYVRTFLSTKDEISEKLFESAVNWKERDLVETHWVFRADGSARVALSQTKVAAFKRDRPENKDLQRQVFFKDEIAPLTDEDKGKIKKKTSFASGCAVFFVVPAAAFAVYWFFFSADETMRRFVFGGIGVAATVFFVLIWLLLSWGNNDELKNNKKRVIVAPVVEIFQKTILGTPTKFYARIRTGTEILEQEISAETYLDLKAGDIVEFQISQNPGSRGTTLQQVTKIADPLAE